MVKKWIGCLMPAAICCLFFIALILVSAPARAQTSLAPLTNLIPPHRITCDPLDLQTTAGIYLYWRGKGATVFNPNNKIRIPIDPFHNPPLYDLLALKLVCGDYDFAATAYNSEDVQSDFSNVVSYSYVYPWCPRVPAIQEPVADQLNRIEAMIRAILLGMIAP